MDGVKFCEECQLKKSSVRKSVVVKPILSNSMNSRCQVDLIDMQSQQDGEYRFILNYQDHLTKFVCLRPLKTKTAEEVAYHLVDIFCDKGAPHILQSDNGREFCNKLITEVLVLWPGCKLVHGKPRHSQSQGSVERANKDVEAILACWQKDYNTTKWSEGLRFVQWQKNTRFHRGIGRTPYEAMFGQKSHLGVTATNLPEDVVDGLETEEQLAEALAADNIQDSTTSMCKDCGGPCSMDDDICHLCERKLGIQAEREGARRKQHSQAEKMQLVSTMRFKKAEVGDSVMVPIPSC
ncbi:KRAB-A domain-containing protein 2-like [Portunus trituberculatus]|uniref:KRAB-A domain-containing protein 2-like n=1 Tax=Portunus trituberculatus TaxID=210409 RepID=UPI001E1CD022|nr:KRAB-A domain-containing protein 2-like [Portunus trituberculatus]